MLIALCVLSVPLSGCEKNSGSPVVSPQPADPGSASVGPPPIASPLGGDPHSGLPEDIAQQHPQAGQIMQQINRYRDRLEEDPDDLEALIALGNANFDIQRFEKARELYERALQVDPRNISVRTDLASCYRNLGDSERAFKELERVLALDSTHETALYNLGVLLLNDREDTEGAIKTWEKLIASHPNLAYAPELRERIDGLKGQSAPARARE